MLRSGVRGSAGERLCEVGRRTAVAPRVVKGSRDSNVDFRVDVLGTVCELRDVFD